MSQNDSKPSVAHTTTEIEAEFGHRWGAWLSDTGCWWAARTRALTADEQAAGCVPYVRAATPGDLREAISAEEHLIHPAKDGDQTS